jgi:hypothetical protein
MPRIRFTWGFPANFQQAQQIFIVHSGNYLLKSNSRADSILAATDPYPAFNDVVDLYSTSSDALDL